MEEKQNLDKLCINTLRFLSVDAVQKANSGHPGLPLGAAPIAYILWDRFLKFNPKNPYWPDRDRFVLSAGHGCALLYSLLHMTGFDLPLEQLQKFRQWESITPGHPEYGIAPGIEATTGPLGQGFGNGVGMAIAETALAARFNRPGLEIVNHHTYILASDGDLMEGVSAEAASLAGHLKLGKLIVLYDNNHISIEGDTQLAFSEDRVARFAAYGWHVQKLDDGNDIEAISAAIESAKSETERPSFIQIRTHIGYGSPNKQDTSAAHGEPLGESEVKLTKKNLGWPLEPDFYIPDEALQHFRKAVENGKRIQDKWESLFEKYAGKYTDLAKEFQRVLDRQLPDRWDSHIPAFKTNDGPMATRVASGKVINAIAYKMPELIGGSADLAPSTMTLISSERDYSAGNRAGRNLHFGVREHGMGAVLNGLALHGGLLPYGATFLIFSDYMRPPIRLAALSNLHVIYVFTHDSIGLGEDGPTHQPIEQLVGLRAVPNLLVMRPADANETTCAWKMAIEAAKQPVALILTRQKLPVLDLEKYPDLAAGVSQGGYILADAPMTSKPDIILIASGSEVYLALEAREKLLQDDINARVVSLPCWELFQKQPKKYLDEVLPENIPALAIEAGSTLGWKSYIGKSLEVIGIDRFGASAPGNIVMEELGFNTYNVIDRVHKILENNKEMTGILHER